jgi:uncharacterized protein (DUF1684 family)
MIPPGCRFPGDRVYNKRMKKKLQLLMLLACVHFSLNAQDFASRTEEFRKEYKAEFLKSERSPLKKRDLKFLRFYQPDSSYRVVATFEKVEKSEPFEMPTYSGVKKPYVVYGLLSFTLHGQKQTLTLYRSIGLQAMPQYKDYLFLPFKDVTNGNATYGGGRYIDMSTKDIKDNLVELDFNKCYNPYCAYSSGYNCPIPPKANHLTVAIEAGEMNYGKNHD